MRQMQDVLEPANAQSVLDEASRNDDNGRNEKTRVVVAVVVAAGSTAINAGNSDGSHNDRRLRHLFERLRNRRLIIDYKNARALPRARARNVRKSCLLPLKDFA